MMHRVQITERGLLHQLVGAGTVKADPIVFPGIGFVGRIGDQLVGFGQKKIPLLQCMGNTAYLVYSLAGNNKMDQVMIPYAGAPGMARFAVFMPAIEDG